MDERLKAVAVANVDDDSQSELLLSIEGQGVVSYDPLTKEWGSISSAEEGAPTSLKVSVVYEDGQAIPVLFGAFGNEVRARSL